MSRQKTLTIVLLFVVSLAGIIFSLPRDLDICPAWEVIVTDQQGSPKEGIEIRQQWKYWGISEEFSQETGTGSDGRARFPARHARASLFSTLFGRAVTLIAVHSSFGPTASIWIHAPKSKSLDQEYWHGKLMHGGPYVSSKGKDRLETTFILVKWDLLDAVNAGDFVFARQILKDDPSMANMRDVLGGTALFSLYKQKGGSIEFAKELIAAGCDVKATDQNNKTALHWAAERGEVELAALFLENGADVKARIRNPKGISEDLDTPLHRAVYSTDDDTTVIRMIDLLVQHGADVNAKAHSDETPLHIAAFLSTPAVIRELRLKGARIDVKTDEGKTPMDLATQFNKTSNIEALR
jgi:ankyrin repeat protein